MSPDFYEVVSFSLNNEKRGFVQMKLPTNMFLLMLPIKQIILSNDYFHYQSNAHLHLMSGGKTTPTVFYW